MAFKQSWTALLHLPRNSGTFCRDILQRCFPHCSRCPWCFQIEVDFPEVVSVDELASCKLNDEGKEAASEGTECQDK
jgi:hypothetical protein